MAVYSSFPNGFMYGVTIRGMPITTCYPGKVFWLNNSSVLPPNGIAGSDNNPGTYQKPWKTIAHATQNTSNSLTQYPTASRGDIIMVMPGHAETISSSTALTLALGGILIVGTGSGALRPTFTLDTATSSTINVTAGQIGFVNCVFVANYASVAACFTLTTAKDFSLSNCEFRDTSSVLNFVNIIKTDSTSNHADGLFIENSNFFGLGAASNTTFINAAGTNDRWTINNCYVAHTATTAGPLMQITSGKNLTNLLIDSCRVNATIATTASSAVMILAASTTSTGSISNCKVRSLCDTTPVLVTASSGLRFYNNYYSSNADKSGFLLPSVDS